MAGPMIITGIGSRKTPPEVLEEMRKVGQWCREQGHTLRSGHAEGADQAFEEGAQERCIAYTPWEGFEEDFKSKAVIFPVQDLEPPARKKAKRTLRLHPSSKNKHQNLGGAFNNIMIRNALQVMGEDMKTPSDAVVYWALASALQAVRVALHFHVPLVDMRKFTTAEMVIGKLERIQQKKGTTS